MSTAKKIDLSSNDTIGIKPFTDFTEDCQEVEEYLELQLKMATSSMNHEYARMEYDDTADRERKQELLDFMHDCRVQYFEARHTLERHNPYAVSDFEQDLMRQKQTIITQYNA